jgi:hypothetical protein
VLQILYNDGLPKARQRQENCITLGDELSEKSQEEHIEYKFLAKIIFYNSYNLYANEASTRLINTVGNRDVVL